MTNAELIAELRGHIREVPLTLLHDAADALEAAERLLDLNTKRCEALRKQLREAHESYEKHLNELEVQLPKEGEWIMDCLAPQMDAHRIGQWAYAPKCSECGTHWDAKTNYCPSCGAKMKTVTDCHALEEENDEQ